jgi:thiamine-monophosphate kinase
VEPAVFAATAGEDYELLVTAAPDAWPAVEAAARATGAAMTRLGLVEDGEGLRLIGPDGEQVTGLRGYEHG